MNAISGDLSMALKQLTPKGKWDHLFNDDRIPVIANRTEVEKLNETKWIGNDLDKSRPNRDMTAAESRAAIVSGLSTSKL